MLCNLKKKILSIFGHSPHKSLISVWTFTHRCQCWTVFSYKIEWFTQCLIIYFVTFVFSFAVVNYFRIWMFLRRHRLLRENVLMRTFWLMVEDRLPFMVKVEWKINFTFRLKFGWEAERHVWESVRCCTSYSSKRPVVYLWQSLQLVIQIKIRRGFKQADLCMKSAMFTVATQMNILNVIFRVVAHSEAETAMIDESQQRWSAFKACDPWTHEALMLNRGYAYKQRNHPHMSPLL